MDAERIDIGGRTPVPCTRRPRVLFVSSSIGSVGGIARYSRALLRSLERVAEVRLLDVTLAGPRDKALALLRAQRELVLQRPDLLVLGHVGFGPIGLYWRMLGGTYVVVAYGIDVWGPASRLDRWTLLRARRIWPISSWTAVEVLRTAPGGKIGVVLGGMVADEFFVDHDRPEPRPRLLVTCRIDDLERKGLATALEVADRLADRRPVELRIVGTGSKVDELLALRSACRHPEVVRYLGGLDDDALRDEYRRADVLLLLSRFARGRPPLGEGLGLVILEAGAAGTPSIAAREGGAVDTLVDGVTGFLVDAQDVDQIVARVEWLLDDDDRRRRMGDAQRRYVETTHSPAAFDARVARALADATA